MSGILSNLPENWRSLFGTDERKEIEFAELYTKHFGIFTEGHSELSLLSKMAYWLDKYCKELNKNVMVDVTETHE